MSVHYETPIQAPARGADEAGSAAAAWLSAAPPQVQLKAKIQHTLLKDLSCNFLSNLPMTESFHDFLIIPLFLGHFEAKPFFNLLFC